MISLDEFKKLLSSAATGKTDAEIESLRQWEYRFADAALEWWQRQPRRPLAILVVDANEITITPSYTDLADDYWHMCGEYNENEMYAGAR